MTPTIHNNLPSQPMPFLRREGELAEIGGLVQGMPLAIELAGAWLKALPSMEVAAEIQRSLDFLATSLRNVPERHRSMRAVFVQSWSHLNEEEREVFKKLAVFQGGFDRPAAVCTRCSERFTMEGTRSWICPSRSQTPG